MNPCDQGGQLGDWYRVVRNVGRDHVRGERHQLFIFVVGLGSLRVRSREVIRFVLGCKRADTIFVDQRSIVFIGRR